MKEQTFYTKDIGIAAYIFMNGLEIVSATREKNGKFSFCFKDPQGLANIYKMNYVNSECQKFDNSLRNLKSLCYSSGK